MPTRITISKIFEAIRINYFSISVTTKSIIFLEAESPALASVLLVE